MTDPVFRRLLPTFLPLPPFRSGAPPPAVFQPVLDGAAGLISRRHPGLVVRLGGLTGHVFRISPVELPIDILLRPAPRPRLIAIAKDRADEGVTASIRGPLSGLVRMVEGKLDGDAMFFSRDLTIEGNTEAIVALRNAVDGAGIDLVEDMLSVLGPLAGPARTVVGGVGSVVARAGHDLARLRQVLLAPAICRCDAQAAEIHELRAVVAQMKRKQDARAPRGAVPASGGRSE